MKPYKVIPIMLMIVCLPLASCNKDSNLIKETASPKNELTKATPTTTVKVQTWSEENSIKYSETKDLIYQLDVRKPEVIIPGNLQTQFRLNRYIRESDMDIFKEYDFMNFADGNYSNQKEDSSFISYYCKSDYTVLKNDGQILSLRQDNAIHNRGRNNLNYSLLNSYDTKTGQKITFDSLSNQPDQLKHMLKQTIANQITSMTGNPSSAQDVMSADLNNYALLSKGLLVIYNPEAPSALIGKEFLVPYDAIEKQLKNYGKELISYTEKYTDEPKVKKVTPDFIFPKSNTAYLTGEDLFDVDKSTLRLARNEIYARHGRKFTSQDLQEYFLSKPWYQANIEGNAFDEHVLNDYEIKNLTAIRTAEDQLNSEEITNHALCLNQEHNYKIDLDCDGICESISWKSLEDNENSPRISLTINGHKQSCIPDDLRGYFQLHAVDLQKNDGEIELALYVGLDNDILDSFIFYRYHNGKLEKIGNLAGDILGGAGNLYRIDSFRTDGSGILTIRADTPFQSNSILFGCYYVDLLYSYKNGKIEEIPQNIYPIKDYRYIADAFNHNNDTKNFVVCKEFTAMKEKDGNTKAFQAMPGETVCPVAWSQKGDFFYVLVMNEAGECGWVKTLPDTMQQDIAYYKEVPAWG